MPAMRGGWAHSRAPRWASGRVAWVKQASRVDLLGINRSSGSLKCDAHGARESFQIYDPSLLLLNGPGLCPHSILAKEIDLSTSQV